MSEKVAHAAARAKKFAAHVAAFVRARPPLREASILLAFCALTVLMTWPWALHWRDAVSDLGDPYNIAYTLWWDYYATFRQPAHLFDATIFYPYRDTLAFSENDYGIALLFFPLFALGVAPLTVHSLATLAAFAFSGYGAFRLTRTLTGSTGAAWIAGIFYAFVPFRFHRLPHLHYIFAGWIPLVLESVVLFVRARTWRRASWMGAAFLMNALSCLTWFVLTLIPLAAAALLLVCWHGAWRDRRLWLRGGLAMALASVLLLPFLLPYRRVAREHGFVRTASESAGFSATMGTWFAASGRNKIWDGFGSDNTKEEGALFPGLLAPMLALCSLLFFASRGAADPNKLNNSDSNKIGDGDPDEIKVSDSDRVEDSNNVGVADSNRIEVSDFERPGDAEPAHGRALKVLLFALDALAVLAVVAAILAATYGTFKLEPFGVRLLKTSHYGRALVSAALLLTLRWVFSRTDAFSILRRRGRAALLRPGANGQALMIGLAWAAIGFMGTLGTNFFFHRLLLEYVELFKSQRVPTRWSMIAYVGLAVLAGLGARRLAELFARRRGPRLRPATVFAAAAALLVCELWAAPVSHVRGQAYPDELTLKLKETKMAAGIVHLPVFGAGSSTFEHMGRAADHRKPLITAASSFLPPLVVRISDLSNQKPIPVEFLDLLESAPASYLVLNYSEMTYEELDATKPLIRLGTGTGRLRFIRRFNDRGLKDLFAVTRWEPDARSEGQYAPPRPRLRFERVDEEAVQVWSLTPEFSEAGSLLYRFYRASYGRAPYYKEFAPDLEEISTNVEFTLGGWQQRLEDNVRRFADRWVEREEFKRLYGSMNERQFVSALASNAGEGLIGRQRREALVSELAAGEETRAGALLRVVSDEEFARRESNPAYVAMHYFSFLERDPDPLGYGGWLNALNASPDRAAFTRAFTSSIEYQAKRRREN